MFYTIGHSTRSIQEFLELLREHSIGRLIDVRTVPRSRTNPQFNRETLPITLREAGIEWEHAPALGGLRRAKPDSPNTGWRNANFRGYADHMASAEFQDALDRVVETGRSENVALMCAEAVPWRCHRSLIADALLARGFEVTEIMGRGKSRPHKMTPFAEVENGRVTYPGDGARETQNPG
ncbi:MAG TPA: DUF488 domain-containing protein [Bryobacteraceae bacterium]|nr:DUF488 domain-containing protein [Bryobacteraceae bacterium]